MEVFEEDPHSSRQGYLVGDTAAEEVKLLPRSADLQPSTYTQLPVEVADQGV
jgi:hypothetical protein